MFRTYGNEARAAPHHFSAGPTTIAMGSSSDEPEPELPLTESRVESLSAT